MYFPGMNPAARDTDTACQSPVSDTNAETHRHHLLSESHLRHVIIQLRVHLRYNLRCLACSFARSHLPRTSERASPATQKHRP
eukprot:57229-Rhodomonas_salina.1